MKTALALLAGAFLLLNSPSQAAESVSANDTARFLAGMPVAPDSPLAPLTRDGGWQHHASQFNATFDAVDKRQMSKIRAWSATHLTKREPTLFYFFSGPDFIYANAFFPDASTYILAGLEPTGEVPDVTRLPRGSIGSSLGAIRGSLSNILSLSFFITHNMRTQLHASRMNGTLPVLYVFLARSGKTIKETSLVYLDDKGEVHTGDGIKAKSAARGAKIVFEGDGGKTQTLYYFSTDLSNEGFARSGFEKFVDGFGTGDALIKSASFLMHGGNFTRTRSFLLDHSAIILQDDSGVPTAQFDTKKWGLHPYGRYLPPQAPFPQHFQPKLAEVFRKGPSNPIDFGIGYRWRPNESNLLLAERIEPGVVETAKADGVTNTTTKAAPTTVVKQEEPPKAKPRKHTASAPKREAARTTRTADDCVGLFCLFRRHN